MCSVNFQIQGIKIVRMGFEMSDYHIGKIVKMVKENLDMDEDKLIDKIDDMLHDSWVAITGFGDD